MPYRVEYFNRRVLDEIESWPVGILADYARLIELLMKLGPDLRMPHSRAFVKKTETTSKRDLGIARRRMKEVQDG